MRGSRGVEDIQVTEEGNAQCVFVITQFPEAFWNASFPQRVDGRIHEDPGILIEP